MSRVKTRWPYKATRASGVETKMSEIQRNFTEKVTSTSRAGQIGKEQRKREQTKLGRGSNGEVDCREGEATGGGEVHLGPSRLCTLCREVGREYSVVYIDPRSPTPDTSIKPQAPEGGSTLSLDWSGTHQN